MNKERIRHMADVIEKVPMIDKGVEYAADDPAGLVCQANIDRFDMCSYYSPLDRGCSTAGCIAGWTVKEYAPDAAINGEHDIYNMAKVALGLNDDEAEDLFEPATAVHWMRIGPANAASVLRAVADGVYPDDAWQAEVERMGTQKS